MIKSFQTAQEITEYRIVAVKNNEIAQAAASTDNVIGVCKPLWGKTDGVIDVALNGEHTEVEAGAAFSIGEALTSDVQGRAIAAKDTDNVCAIALDNAAAAGDVVDVVVVIQRKLAAAVATPPSQQGG